MVLYNDAHTEEINKAYERWESLQTMAYHAGQETNKWQLEKVVQYTNLQYLKTR